jgi:hypothetical protein
MFCMPGAALLCYMKMYVWLTPPVPGRSIAGPFPLDSVSISI